MKKVLILHSWYGKPNTGWYAWLANELKKKGYDVQMPTIPTYETNAPDMETALRAIMEMKYVDQETTVIGHSLGSVLTLRLAERVPFARGVLVAGWDYNDLTPEHQSFWKTMMDHATIKKNVAEWVVPISDNDPYVTAAIAEEMAARLGGKALRLGVKGHFTEKDGVTEIPEILEYL